MKGFISRMRGRYTAYTVVALFIFVFALAIHITSILSPRFADFYIRYPGAAVRAGLSYLTRLLPFSLAETVVILMPFLIIMIVCLATHFFKKGDAYATKMTAVLAATVSLFYSTFVLGFGMGYCGTDLSEKLGLEVGAVSKEELVSLAELTVDRINRYAADIEFSPNGFAEMPYSFAEMNNKLNEAYKSAAKKYDFIPDLNSKVKRIALSKPLTYTHISGMYTYYTGEANVNINYPDFIIPYTTAHEMAHQRGIAREDEANFVALLVCLESDDDYIRYSCYMNLYGYLVSPLYEADSREYYRILYMMDRQARDERIAYSAFFDRYRESAASDVSSAINNTYLKLQGEESGERSYGEVIDLAVAFNNAGGFE